VTGTGESHRGAAGRRLIEDVLPIAAINVVAQREKIGHAELHPRKLHLWWARRPLAAARAAVYAALVPAEGRNRSPEEEASFFDSLCRWGGPSAAISAARAEVLVANGGEPPAVLDLFAGGGAIPLEAARLGCRATAVELNPVAHMIQKAMLEFPQQFPALGDDIRSWGTRWVDAAWKELSDLYPSVGLTDGQGAFAAFSASKTNPESEGRRPIAYLWTRTVRCPNPALAEHRLHLLRQTWLARKKKRCIALRPVVDQEALTISYEVVQGTRPPVSGSTQPPGRVGERRRVPCAAPPSMPDTSRTRAWPVAWGWPPRRGGGQGVGTGPRIPIGRELPAAGRRRVRQASGQIADRAAG